jgi:4-aminobutyrate aminotransferase-like enzyme
MGRYFTDAAWALNDPWIGDVRFTGLLGGIELVADRDTREVLGKKQMAAVKDRLHAEGMLVTISGLYGNVLRLQPPLSVTASQIDLLISALGRVLTAVRQSV